MYTIFQYVRHPAIYFWDEKFQFSQKIILSIQPSQRKEFSPVGYYVIMFKKQKIVTSLFKNLGDVMSTERTVDHSYKSCSIHIELQGGTHQSPCSSGFEAWWPSNPTLLYALLLYGSVNTVRTTFWSSDACICAQMSLYCRIQQNILFA